MVWKKRKVRLRLCCGVLRVVQNGDLGATCAKGRSPLGVSRKARKEINLSLFRLSLLGVAEADGEAWSA